MRTNPFLITILTLPSCAVLDHLTTSTPTDSVFIEMCRDDRDSAKDLVNTALQNGWRYEGPAFNDGMNCTVTLWVR